MEAPRREAGFRVIFGFQNDALQMGYGAGNKDRPGKFPSKMKLGNALSSARYTRPRLVGSGMSDGNPSSQSKKEEY